MSGPSHHILIVDDARDIREPLGQYLRKHGLRTTLAADSKEARQALSEAGIDLVILDIMMPGEDGLSLCRWMVDNTAIPVILLTAMATGTDRIVGLELGADDYVVKPFNPRELLARIKAVLRRVPERQQQSSSHRFAGWLHDGTRKSLRHDDGREMSLTTSENRLLTVLLQNPNKVLSRAALLDHVAGREERAFDRTIDNQVGRLRKKIEDDPSVPSLLITEWGGGYKLAVETVVPV
ncbi:response regulator [Aliiroseovarius sp. 2305UL8-7]|uniref:response regulator n=1 Tax=Aliiroseovarius conchicola TaxID=3121637 RepID=UPI0035290D8F